MSDTALELTAEARHEIVSFMIRDQAYCLEIEHVLEIRGWTKTTALPHAPSYVLGLMNLRGTVLPVVDLSARLGLGATQPESRHVIIIAIVNDKTAGFLVDTVSDIAMVSESDLQATPNVSSEQTSRFIQGIYMIGDELVRAINANEIVPNNGLEEAVA